MYKLAKKIGESELYKGRGEGTLPQKQGQSWSWDQSSQIESHTDQHQSKSAHFSKIISCTLSLKFNRQDKMFEKLNLKFFSSIQLNDPAITIRKFYVP